MKMIDYAFDKRKEESKNTVLLTRCITYLRRSLGYSGGINPPHGGQSRSIAKLRTY